MIVRRFILMLMILMGVGSESSQAIVTSDVAGSHVTTPGVPSFGVNTDGVVLLATDLLNSDSIDNLSPLCSGALISDRHILTAAHCYDYNSDGIVDSLLRAYPQVAAFELSTGPVFLRIDVNAIQFPNRWPGSALETSADLAILTLEEDAPAGVPRYTLYGASDEVGHSVVLAGYGVAGHGSTGADDTLDDEPTKRSGLNRFEEIRIDTPGVELLALDFDSGIPANNALEQIGFQSDLGLGVDEVFFSLGDSGGPAFINGIIAGVSSFAAGFPVSDTTAMTDFSWGEIGFYARVSTYRTFILQATGGTALFVPEPKTAVLLSWTAATALIRIPRRS